MLAPCWGSLVPENALTDRPLAQPNNQPRHLSSGVLAWSIQDWLEQRTDDAVQSDCGLWLCL